MAAKNTIPKMIAVLFACGVLSLGIFFTRHYLKQQIIPSSVQVEESKEIGSDPEDHIISCPDNEKFQLMDSEKCRWACSTFYTAPTEQRCVACRGIIVPQNCPMCPSLCAASMWLLEKKK